MATVGEPTTKRSISLVHLSGPRRGQIDELAGLPATIGSDPGERGRGPRPRSQTHALLGSATARWCSRTRARPRAPCSWARRVREAVLRNGDVIELGPGGPKLRYRCEGEQRVAAS